MTSVNTVFIKHYKGGTSPHGFMDGALQPLKVVGSAIDQQLGFNLVPRTFFHKIDSKLTDSHDTKNTSPPSLFTVSVFVPNMYTLHDYKEQFDETVPDKFAAGREHISQAPPLPNGKRLFCSTSSWPPRTGTGATTG
jgi:hypothetical protein